MIAQTPSVNSCQPGTNRYCITLFTHGRRALLAGDSADGGARLPMPTGNGVAAVWLALSREQPQLITEAFYLMPSSICVLVRVKGGMGDTAALRLLHSAIRRFKDETTHQYNSGSAQDYRSRLWQTAFGCKPVDTPDQHAKLVQQMAAQGAYRAM